MRPEWKSKMKKSLDRSNFMQKLRTQGTCFKTLYITAALLVTVGFVIHLTINVVRFLSKPVITERVHDNVPAQFPVVIICPEAPLSHHKRSRVSVFRDGIEFPMWKVTLNADRYWRYVKGLPMEFSEAKWDTDDLERVSVRPYIEESGGMRNAEDYVLSCKYMGEDCSFINFTSIYHPHLLTCAAFQPINKEISSTGIDSGLQLMLYTKDFSAMLQVDEMVRLYAGFHVFIVSNSSKSLDVAQAATFAGTGHYTEIAFTSTFHRILTSEKSNCNTTLREAETLSSSFDYSKSLRLPYTGQLCLDDTFQQELWKQCQCYSETRYLLQNEKLNLDNFCLNIPQNLLLVEKWDFDKTNVWVQPAGTNTTKNLSKFKAEIKKSKSRLECLKKQESIWQRRKTDASHICHVPCEFTDFELSMEKTVWPYRALYAAKPIKDAMEEAIKYRSKLKKPTEIWDTVYQYLNTSNRLNDVENLRDRFLLLDIYPNSPTSDKIYQDWAYPPEALLSDLGGIMGLWLGLSILAMFEVAELLSIPCQVCCCSSDEHTSDEDQPVPVFAKRHPETSVNHNQIS